ncbi:MAG: ATP-binding protein [Bacteroidetes bacterium]|nr:ATP-binding protein [Bacteroidota bacterium]
MKNQHLLPKDIIERKMYLENAISYIGKDIVKIFIGQRRVGKSYILYQLMSYIEKNKTHSNIVYINKELSEFRNISNHDDLIDYVKSFEKKSKNYLFIDEVQEISGFEKALRALLASKKWDIWCTGSNAELLSVDIAGIMSGRSIEIPVNTLCYSEFLTFHKLKPCSNSLNLFIKYGGLPYLHNLELSDNIVYEYLRGIYSTILYKDIIARHHVRNTRFVEDLVSFIADNTGSQVSAKKISDFLKSQKINIAPVRVIEYLRFLCDACFLIKIPRADLQGKRIFEIGEKYYFKDIGLRNAIGGYKPQDINKIIENIVLLHMLYNGYKAYTGSYGAKEIDFVFEKNQKRIYIQVAYLISDQKVYEREFGNLKLVDDNYPKYVVSMDAINLGDDKGITHIKLEDFLLMSF